MRTERIRNERGIVGEWTCLKYIDSDFAKTELPNMSNDPSTYAALERWERDYQTCKDLLMKTAEPSKKIELAIAKLEKDLKLLRDDGSLQHKRTRLADLIRTMSLRKSAKVGRQYNNAYTNNNAANAFHSKEPQARFPHHHPR